MPIEWCFKIKNAITQTKVITKKLGTREPVRRRVERAKNARSKTSTKTVISTDHGGENVKIAQFMLKHRGLNSGSVMTARLAHNQRMALG